jgi:signal transduction histidine kinase
MKNKVTEPGNPAPQIAATLELETEIEKLGQEVHDKIGQSVTAIKFMVDIMANTPGKDQQLLSEMRTLVHQTQVDVRALYNSIQSISKRLNAETDNTLKQ